MPKNIIGKRCFICCNDPFPYGTANSNYIRNLALLLQEAGAKVTILGLKETKYGTKSCEKGEYKGIDYINLILPKSKFPFRVRNHLFLGRIQKKILESLGLSVEDYVFVYTDFISVSQMLVKHFSEINERGHLIYIIVEWFQSQQYSMGGLNWDYLLWKKHFDTIMPKYKKVITISENLKQHFDEVGCNTFVLPCLVNTNDNAVNITSKKPGDKYYFIYPGSATNKDSLVGMINGFGKLEDKELERVEMHFTSLTPEKLMKITQCSDLLTGRLRNVFVFHGWLEYDKLLSLYRSMDFIFLAREKNIITLSNFPSKIPEMLAYGVVPVCSAVGDYTRIYLEDGVDSIIFEGASAEDCVNAIRNAMSINEEKLVQMKRAARVCAKNKFDYRMWVKRIVEFLQS